MDDIFRKKYIHYAIGRIGIVPTNRIDDVADKLDHNAIVETENGDLICKLLIANDCEGSETFIFRTLNSIEDFIIFIKNGQNYNLR